MKKDDNSQKYTQDEQTDNDLEFINLEETPTPPKRFRINMHMVFFAVVAVLFCVIFFRIKNWGVFISPEEIENIDVDSHADTMDLILPLTQNHEIVYPNLEDGLSIVFFGNAPLADDRHSEDNLVNMIGQMTGATVYNCSVGESYLAAEWPYFSAADRPMDAYNLYWLACLASDAGNDATYVDAPAALGDALPPDAIEAVDTLQSIDFSTVDVIAIMYDAYDYFLAHPTYNSDNPTDIMHFTGNLEAGIEFLQNTYPNIRIIVMSPTYAFSDKKDENGEYLSSDIVTYGIDILSSYVIKQQDSCASRQVTFIDNLYGTITEDNAKEYLIDNRHLNVEGRKKVAERFVYALNYYSKK